MGRIGNLGDATVVDLRRQQRSFGDGFIRETVDQLWEGWMRHADELLADEALLETVHHALQHRCPRAEGKLVSIFEPHTEIIRKGKASKPTEFGKLVKLQEAENQIIIAYEVYDQRPNDKDLLVPAVQVHEQRLECIPELVAGDAGFYSAQGEAAVQKLGVKRVSIPNHSTKSTERRRLQKSRWFRKGQKWRTGCEGRISLLKRRHGLNRCRYKGTAGMKRWVGLGVIGDNLINIGRALDR
jgi:transposase, IS5 family